MFHLIVRDEARPAGFLNKPMEDFNRMLDLGYFTKACSNTFSPIDWIIYTVAPSFSTAWITALT